MPPGQRAVTIVDRARVDRVRKHFQYLPSGPHACLLYTSDAADERSSVDLGGRRIIKKKKKRKSQ